VQSIRKYLHVETISFCTEPGQTAVLEPPTRDVEEGRSVKAIIILRQPSGHHRAAEEDAKANGLGLRYLTFVVFTISKRRSRWIEF
jgi:hypothetical protein